MGVAIQQQHRLMLWVDRGTTTAVYLLLFLLGIAVGGNTAVMNALATLGLQALLLSLGGMAGSIALAFLLYRWQFQSGDEDA